MLLPTIHGERYIPRKRMRIKNASFSSGTVSGGEGEIPEAPLFILYLTGVLKKAFSYNPAQTADH